MAEKIKLTPRDIADAMSALPEWSCDGERLARTFVFPDFMSAIAFIQRLAPHAEAMDHHPELFNVYNRVRVELTTHDANGLTDADFALASVINALA
jgi:4a-hydroxytetrahydrobiopterin dehydratase